MSSLEVGLSLLILLDAKPRSKNKSGLETEGNSRLRFQIQTVKMVSFRGCLDPELWLDSPKKLEPFLDSVSVSWLCFWGVGECKRGVNPGVWFGLLLSWKWVPCLWHSSCGQVAGDYLAVIYLTQWGLKDLLAMPLNWSNAETWKTDGNNCKML